MNWETREIWLIISNSEGLYEDILVYNGDAERIIYELDESGSMPILNNIDLSQVDWDYIDKEIAEYKEECN